MLPLDALLRDAQALASGQPAAPDRLTSAATAEVARVMQICNACRYCEGYCAVFPAMTRRLAFSAADAHYLANLCHQCGACLQACQYALPHEFAVNVPQAFARVRGQTYAAYAWPTALAGLYRRNGLTVALALAAGLALFMALVWAMQGQLPQPSNAHADGFYAVLTHGLLVSLFLPVFGFAALALGLGVRRFWRESPPGDDVPAAIDAKALAEASGQVLRLTHLGGGHGQGCHDGTDLDADYSLARRRWHHLTFYGFGLCFAATLVGTLYHYALGWPAPYAFSGGWHSLPKWLGTVGGVSLAVGCAGLWRLNLRRPPEMGDAAQQTMDRGFIALLLLTAVSGLALPLLGQTRAMPAALVVHLGAVMALFATLPYGKFAHGVYRCAALLKAAVERRLPLRSQTHD